MPLADQVMDWNDRNYCLKHVLDLTVDELESTEHFDLAVALVAAYRLLSESEADLFELRRDPKATDQQRKDLCLQSELADRNGHLVLWSAQKALNVRANAPFRFAAPETK